MTTESQQQPSDLVSETEAAKALALSPGTLKAARNGRLPHSPLRRLPHVRIGKSIRYRRSDIEDFIQAQIQRREVS